MAIINYINTGSGANSGDGDSLRTAFNKINLNFDSLISNFVAAGVTSWNNRVGVVEFTNNDLLTLLGYTPYPNTNPDGFVTSSTIELANYATINYVNTAFVFVSDLAAYNFASTNYVDLKLTEYPTLQYLDDQQYLTSINLPNFLTSYITDSTLAEFGDVLRTYTDTGIFNAVNNTSIIPAQADIYNLGDEAYRWSTLHLANAVYIQGIGISVNPIDGTLIVNGNPVTGGFSLGFNEIYNIYDTGINISAASADTRLSGIYIPSTNGSALEPLEIYNDGNAGVSIAGTSTVLSIDGNGSIGIAINTQIILPLTLQGNISYDSLNDRYSGDHYLTIETNGWSNEIGWTDIEANQQLVSYKTSELHAPITIKGSRVVLFASTNTDAVLVTDDTPPSAYVALDETGFYVGYNVIKGNGDPGLFDPTTVDNPFFGYRLPLTRGELGQTLAVTSTSTILDTVEWVTLSSGSGGGFATTSTLVNGNYTISLSTTGTLTVPGSIIPDTDVAYDLGSPTNRFRDIYVSSSTIYLGTSTISVSSEGQMLVNGNTADAKLEYFGGEGFGPRDAGYIAWNTSTFTFNLPGKELLTAIYDLKPGNKIRVANTFGFDQEFTIAGNAREYIRDGSFQMAAIDVVETTSTNVFVFSLYLPVKDKSATVSNGTWTVTVSTTGTLTVPSHIIPDTDVAYDLGSSTKRFRDLYLSGNTINLGAATISATGSAVELPVGTTTGGVSIGTIIILGSVADATALTAISTATLAVGDSYVVASPAPAHLWTYNGQEFIDLGVFQGPQGVRGFDGSQGDVGYTGSFGFVGSAGVAGTAGFTGSSGSSGASGFTGSGGENGFTGSQGDIGDIGYTGSQGTQGDQGVVGFVGSQGVQGPAGNNASISFSISASGSSDYVFSGPGIVAGNTNDPVLYLYRGFTYTFINTTGGSHPFAIRVSNGGADYTSGVSGSQTGTQTFTVPMNAPTTLYYQCTLHSSMGNVINIV